MRSSSNAPPYGHPVSFILARRHGQGHRNDQIAAWIADYAAGYIPDYQMSAWLMATCFQPLSVEETSYLTAAMVDSGEVLNWTLQDGRTLCDKHSSGGVGDKVSLVLAPLVAAASKGKVNVPMMAGRGLGHTGGTIDKLETIRGFNAQLDIATFQRIVDEVGCAITATGPTLCPADQKLYALRDVTATVSSIPLQTASIMCKKIAEHPQSILLDVKYGQGSFQSTVDDAHELATSMIATGESNGLNTVAFLTNMDHPLGTAVGNWIEVYECSLIMRGDRSPVRHDLYQLTVLQATQMLIQSGYYHDWDETLTLVMETLEHGHVLAKFRDMVLAQGGEVSWIDEADIRHNEFINSVQSKALCSPVSGYITNIHALTAGEVAVDLGAGRKVADDDVHPIAGIWFEKKVGDYVQRGDILAHVYSCFDKPKEGDASDGQYVQEQNQLGTIMDRLQGAIEFSEHPCTPPQIITHKVTTDGIVPFEIPKKLRLGD